eukprot:gene21375-biopygen7324
MVGFRGRAKESPLEGGDSLALPGSTKNHTCFNFVEPSWGPVSGELMSREGVRTGIELESKLPILRAGLA